MPQTDIAVRTAPTKQFPGKPYYIHKRRKTLVTQSENFTEADEQLNALIQKYGAKYCLVCARKDGVNIKLKIKKRIYFFSLAENFSASVKKLSDLVEKYYPKKVEKLTDLISIE